MIKGLINKFLFKTTGYRLGKPARATVKPEFYNSQNLLYEKDMFFHQTYEEGIEKTQTPYDTKEVYFTRRRNRFYNTIQFFMNTVDLDGFVIECGCYRGLSSYMMCHHYKKVSPDFVGNEFVILDSFEGLSKPNSKDALEVGRDGSEKFFVGEGFFATPVEHVKLALSEFPQIEYVKGWVPEILYKMPLRKYKFVHIDLDLYEPILGALEYFYPLLVTNATIVIDDYGSLYWPGAKKAVEEFCLKNKLRFLSITSGQGVIIKKE